MPVAIWRALQTPSESSWINELCPALPFTRSPALWTGVCQLPPTRRLANFRVARDTAGAKSTAAAIPQDYDCVRHDLNPRYASATCILLLRCLYQSAEPVAQKRCLLLKIPNGIFNQSAIQKRTATVDYERCCSYLVGQFRRTTCEVNHDQFRIERDEDCR